jgi:hypothetical protein
MVKLVVLPGTHKDQQLLLITDLYSFGHMQSYQVF